LNTNNPNDLRVTWGKLKDGWTYDVERIPKSDRFRVTVLRLMETLRANAGVGLIRTCNGMY